MTPREYADLLIGSMRDPIKYEVQAVGGPGMPGTLLIEGERRNVQRRYVSPPMPHLNSFNPAGPMLSGFGDLMTSDANGLPVIVRNSGVSGYSGPDGYVLFGSPRMGGLNSSDWSGPAAGSTQPDSDLVRKMIQDPAHAGTTLSAAQAGRPLSPQARIANAARQGLLSRGANPAGNTILLGQAIVETQNNAMALQQQLEADVAALERSNAETRDLNGRLAGLLNETTGQDLGPDRNSWQGWWIDQLGYAQKRPYESPKPTVVEVVTRPLPPVAGFEDNQNGYVRRISCFGAGTPVHTLSGVQPIETLKEGDRVLTQDLKTGALGYKPILVVHHNPPSPTYRIALGTETIVSSHFHRFWKAGQGWVMARDLAPGDRVRTLGGLVPVGSIDASEVQPVFNLDVAEDADFFVGRQGALVHDNTLPELKQTPFDAPPESVATSTATATAKPVTR